MKRHSVERTDEVEIRLEDQSEKTELSGEFMEGNTVERARRQKQTQEQYKQEWASLVGLCL